MRIKTDSTSRAMLCLVVELEKAFEIFMRPRWFRRRPDAHDVSHFANVIAKARADSWSHVYSKYPQVTEGSWTVGMVWISCNDPDVTKSN